MKNHLSYWMKGKIWRFPLSLSLFLLPPTIYASEVQMEAVKPISIQLTDVSLSEAMSQIEKVHIPVDTRSAFPVISVQSPVSIQYRWQS